MVNIISAGHQQGGGAFGIFSETTENRKVVQAIKNIDNSILDVTINYSIDADNELIQKVKKVNELCKNNEVYCYSDIHFNASTLHNGVGVECVVLAYESGLYANKQSYEDNYNKAKSVCEAISRATGLFNRGVKTNNDFYVLRKPNCHSMIIEICFLDNAEDVKKYNCNVVAAAIVEGLKGKATVTAPPVNPIAPPVKPSSGEYQINNYYETGKCTICVKEGVYFYNKPFISEITGSYEYNESVNYDYVVITNKYVYISWVSASTGIRRYMPVLDKTNNERWGKCI